MGKHGASGKHLAIEHMLKHRETIKDSVLDTEIYILENAL